MSFTPPNQENPSLVTIIYGDATRAEFAPLLADFDACDTVIHCEQQKTTDTEKKNADLVFFWQSFPGEFSQELVETQRRAAPLAPLVVICGAWCEGEERTGSSPLIGVSRFYATQWKFIARAELAALRAERFSRLSLPITSGEDERALAEAVLNAKQKFLRDAPISITLGESALLGVDAAMSEMLWSFFSQQVFLQRACQVLRTKIPSARDENNVSNFTILDVAAASQKTIEQEIVRWAHPRTRLILLMPNPRHDEIETFGDLDAAAVFPKPFSLFALARFIGSLGSV